MSTHQATCAPMSTDLDTKPILLRRNPRRSSAGRSSNNDQEEALDRKKTVRQRAKRRSDDVTVKVETTTTSVVKLEQAVEAPEAPVAGPSSAPVDTGLNQDDPSSSILPKKRAKKEKRVEEARPGRFRKQCPVAIRDRVARVMSQRMFMVDRDKTEELCEVFKVLGSTGNVYTVTINQTPCCDCPDCSKGNVPCKHILFVLLKILKVPLNSNIWYQKGLLKEEIEQVFAGAPESATVAINTKIRNAYLKATGVGGEEEVQEDVVQKEVVETGPGSKRLSSIGEDCPVCYEEMSEEDEKAGRLVYDEALAGCGKPLHKECFGMWVATATKKGDTVTCVWCRTPWPSQEGGSSGDKGKGGVAYSTLGYLNMADVAGVSRERDTSTYYWGPMRGRRMWQGRYEDD